MSRRILEILDWHTTEFNANLHRMSGSCVKFGFSDHITNGGYSIFYTKLSESWQDSQPYYKKVGITLWKCEVRRHEGHYQDFNSLKLEVRFPLSSSQIVVLKGSEDTLS